MSAPAPASAPEGGAADPYLPFRHELLSPEEVRELSRIEPGRALRDAAWLWAQIVAAWTAAALWPVWWVVGPAIVVVGTREYALQVIGHDGIHRRLAAGRRRNDLLSDLLCMAPVGAITRINGRNHRLHHRLLAREGDPDRFKYDETAKESHLGTFVFLAGLSGLLRVLQNVFLQPLRAGGALEPKGERESTGRSAQGYAARDLALLGAWQGALVVGLSAAVGWWGYPLLWLLPVYAFTFCPNLARQFLEHAHSEPGADRHRLKSFVSNPVERVLMAPCNMNHHAAHHLWPSIPYYRLPEADRRLRERSRSDRIHWKRSYAEALGEWLRARPALSRERRAPARSPE